MGVPAEKLYTLEEYVALEVSTGIKHEYDRGVVTVAGLGRVKATVGGTPEHARLAARLASVLENHLTGKPCKPFSSDLKIKAGARFVYPDVTVLCPPVKRDPELRDVVENPKVIFEVISDSTEAYDRGEKFALYRQNLELTDYILISPTRRYAEHYMRIDADHWNLAFLGPDSMLHLPGIECEIPLAVLYEGMELLMEQPAA